ncbi:putative peptidyl-prolyl cis-trans isomerase B isoform X1 [Apostichopus japonicus]|uniref:Peptidyl-prolyl cis-trans isomerase n=1 Tax=Stichopus japonicus TaxID=307972 RepID=A0A2G8LAM4_STIJA|nr:putative peptidyl-prolyl cis-trans isomerase B isoform X1 [Apostichopus japonicus]
MRRQGTIIALVLTILFETWSIEALKNRGPKKPKPWEDPDRDTSDDLLVTKKVYFDIEIDDEPIGKIVIALFGETCPVTVQNFAALARGGWKRDTSLTYNNTIVHRIVPDFVIQMGDVTDGDGTGGRSIYGKHFADENFFLRHLGRGWVAMANSGPDTNNSQFYILLTKAGWLDGKHVVFGKVIDGMDVVDEIADIDTDQYGFPLKIVRVIDCGVIHVKEPYHLPHPTGNNSDTE